MRKTTAGFSLIELVVFIVILAIVATAALLSFQTLLTLSPNTEKQTAAIELGQGRMEVIMGQYYQNGFSSFSDPCYPSVTKAVCQSLAGYTVTSGIVTSGATKTITVTVTGPGSAILTTVVSQ